MGSRDRYMVLVSSPRLIMDSPLGPQGCAGLGGRGVDGGPLRHPVHHDIDDAQTELGHRGGLGMTPARAVGLSHDLRYGARWLFE